MRPLQASLISILVLSSSSMAFTQTVPNVPPPANDAAKRVRDAFDAASENASNPLPSAEIVAQPVETTSSRDNGQMLVLSAGVKGANSEVEAAPWLESDLLFQMAPTTWFGPGIAYWKADNKVETLSKGNVSALPFLVKIRSEATTSSKIHPYAEISGGYFLIIHDLDPSVKAELEPSGLSLTEEIDNEFGGLVLLGFDISPAQQSAIAISASYLFLKPRVTATVRDVSGRTVSVSDRVDLGGLIVTLNGQIRF